MNYSILGLALFFGSVEVLEDVEVYDGKLGGIPLLTIDNRCFFPKGFNFTLPSNLYR